MAKILILVLLAILTTISIVNATLVTLAYDDGSAEDGVCRWTTCGGMP